MNGAECGECGNIQCTCDKYPLRLGLIYYELKTVNLPAAKQALCMQGILMVFDRIESEGKLTNSAFIDLQIFLSKLQCLINPPRRAWWRFWKRS